MDKYKYLTGEDLDLKPSTVEQAKFEYSPLGMILTNNSKSRTNKSKVYKQNKQNKNLTYNAHHSLEILVNLKNCHSILCIKD